MFESLGFLLVGGWLFWGLVALFLVANIFLLSNEAESAAMIFSSIFFGFLFFFTDTFRSVSLYSLLLYAAIYVGAGVGWSLWKWRQYIYEKVEEAKRSHVAWESKKPLAEFAEDFFPDASKNKERILSWMILWPFSFAWDILTWPRRLFTFLYEYLTTTFQRIAKSIWESALK